MVGFLKKHCEAGGRSRDRKATENALLLAASRLFAQKGYENTRTLEIAKEAGVNEALILRYFGGKEGLLAAVLKDEAALQSLMSSQQMSCCSETDAFPAANAKLGLKAALLEFYDNARKIVEVKESFMRIASSRALVDQEMADVVRQKMIEQQTKILEDRVLDFFKAQGKQIKPKQLESLVMLLSSTNYVMNFMGRKVYKVDEKRVDTTVDFLCELIADYFD